MATKKKTSRKPGGATGRSTSPRSVSARRKPAAMRRRLKTRASAPVQKNTPSGGLPVLFPKLTNAKNRFGLGVAMVRAVRDGGPPKYQVSKLEEASQKPAMRPRAALTARIDTAKVAGKLGGLAHPDRIRLAIAMMTGADTHLKLRTETHLAAGPLYHHLRAMQLAGLVHQPSRNFYTLTEQGEMLLLIAACIG